MVRTFICMPCHRIVLYMYVTIRYTTSIWIRSHIAFMDTTTNIKKRERQREQENVVCLLFDQRYTENDEAREHVKRVYICVTQL